MKDESNSQKTGAHVGNSGPDYEIDQTDAFTTNMVFSSRESLIEWVRYTGKLNGVCITIIRSDSGETRKLRTVFSCERSGTYRQRIKKDVENDKKRYRETSTKKCGCPFLLSGKKLDMSNDWAIEVLCGIHNHPSATYLEGHSFAGRLTTEETELLIYMSKSNIMPREILTTLKQRDSKNVSTIGTIYNARHKHRVTEMGGRSQIQQLMKKLSENHYTEWHRCTDDTDTITDLFFAHPKGIDLLRAFPHVLIMDCTYKTNIYRLPLLEIVGVTSIEYTYAIAFVFLESKREENYVWTLDRLKTLMHDESLPGVIVTDRELALMNAISTVFPLTNHLLCRWHISKNILANTKKYFELNEIWDEFLFSWHTHVSSSTIILYKEQLKNLEETFSKYEKAIQYAQDNWLSKYKEKFIGVWTNSIMHFGNVTTNRVESAHARLKRYLRSSQGNFETSWSAIHDLLVLQHTEIKVSFARSLTTVQHNFIPFFFKELRGFVSRSALDKIMTESNRGNEIGIDVLSCGCVIRRTHGLPCAHELNGYKLENRPIPLACVHNHWKKLDFVAYKEQDHEEISCDAEVELFVKRFKAVNVPTKLQLLRKLRELADPTTTFLTEPNVKRNTRGRSSSKCDTSTRRDPSALEYVSLEDNISSRSYAFTSKAKKSMKPKVSKKKGRKKTQSIYMNQFPPELKSYIWLVKDVVADGNCGFRAIADLMGMGEENWLQVRKDLISELLANHEDYIRVYGCSSRVEEILHSLSYFDNCPSIDYWMTMPDMGHIIVSHFNVVLIHLSMQQCPTFLPLKSNPLPITQHKMIAIEFVNGNHFVEVFMHIACPIPQIATNWYRHHHSCANGWETPYLTRIKQFCDLLKTNVVTQETIDLDSS